MRGGSVVVDAKTSDTNRARNVALEVDPFADVLP